MKMSLLKRTILFLLVIAFLFVSVSCDKGTEKDDSKDSKQSGESKDADKPEKITMMSTTTLKKEQGHKQLTDKFKEYTGIELEIVQPAHNQYYDVMATKFASNSVPDVVEIGGEYYVKYATDGAFVDVTEKIENSDILNKIDKNYLDAVKVSGKVYGVPLQTGGGCLTYMRGDWLKDLGLEAPTTYDEFIEVLKAFRDKDPNKTGKDDTIPYTTVLSAEDKLQLYYLRDFFWDASPEFTLLDDGKWIDGFAQDNWKEALKRLADAYKEKLIDQEIFTNKTSTCRDKFFGSKVGAFPYWNNYWISRLEDNTRQTSNKEAVVQPIPAIKEGTCLNRPPVVTAITTKAKNVDGIFKHFMEYIHDGEEGQILFSFGAEGTHWEKRNDGKVEMLPDLSNPEQKVDKVWFSSDNTILPYNKGPIVPMDPRIESTLTEFKKKFKQITVFPLSPTYASNMAEIDKKRLELAAKAIKGDITPEEAVENYKKETAKLEIPKILEEFNSGK